MVLSPVKRPDRGKVDWFVPVEIEPGKYQLGDWVLLSAENIRFRHGTRKLCPRSVGPFSVQKL